MQKTEQGTGENPLSVSQEFFSIRELSVYVGVRISTLYAMVGEKKIPHYKIGRLVRFKRSEIDLWLEGNRRECIDPEEVARKALRPVQRHDIDVDRITGKAVDGVKGRGYTTPCGKTRPSQRPQKGGL